MLLVQVAPSDISRQKITTSASLRGGSSSQQALLDDVGQRSPRLRRGCGGGGGGGGGRGGAAASFLRAVALEQERLVQLVQPRRHVAVRFPQRGQVAPAVSAEALAGGPHLLVGEGHAGLSGEEILQQQQNPVTVRYE